jgi:hypothetical protein
VPRTGDTGAFVALKQAYDVLSNPERRAAYDRRARDTAMDAVEPEVFGTRGTATRGAATQGTFYQMMDTPVRQPRFSDLPTMLWVGVGVFLCFGVFEAVTHLLAPSPTVREDIRPNAATVAPLSPSAHEAVLYGPAPVRLAGSPNFYVIPVGSPAVLWKLDGEHDTMVPVGQLPPFSMVQGVRLIRQNGMVEVLLNDRGANGLISADHLNPGDALAARRAYCTYNAGPTPYNGELLQRRGYGGGSLEIENRAVQPAVVKLRDATGAVTLSVFLGPGDHAGFDRLPDGDYHIEFAIGELWSRACNTFAAGMRARRMKASLTVSAASRVIVKPDPSDPAAVDIPDQVFERN